MKELNEDHFDIKGTFDAGFKKTAIADIYNLESWLLSGNKISCLISHLKLGIGGSSLPRRIMDCREHLGMTIEPQDPHAPKTPHIRADGKKTYIREYFMTEENIKKYSENMPAKAKYPPKTYQKKGTKTETENPKTYQEHVLNYTNIPHATQI